MNLRNAVFYSEFRYLLKILKVFLEIFSEVDSVRKVQLFVNFYKCIVNDHIQNAHEASEEKIVYLFGCRVPT